ncbi:MAG: LysR family transcriptional regulator [Pseudomonadota bacterium]
MAMNVTIKQLRYAETAGRRGSIAAAAAEHNISQSSVTAAIDALEGQFGFDIFIRQPAKGISPTPSGAKALELVAGVLRQFTHFETEVEALGGAPRGVLRLGCYVTVAPGFLPRALSAFTDRYPEAQAEISEGDMQGIAAQLEAGTIDLACTYEQATRKDFDFIPLFEAPPYVLLPEDDPLADAPFVTAHDILDRPFILLDLSHTRDYFTSLFKAEGLRPRLAHTTRSSEIVRAMVAGRFGVSILNIVHRGEAGYRTVPLKSDQSSPVFGVAMLRGVRPPLMSRVFIEELRRLRDARAFDDIVIAAG